MENRDQIRIDAVNHYLTTKLSLDEVVERFDVSRADLFQTMLDLRRPPIEPGYGISMYLANLYKTPPESEDLAE